MATTGVRAMDLHNETGINVVGLLKDQLGSTRLYALRLDRFLLDEDLIAENVVGEVKLTRLRDGIMAKVRVGGGVVLECVRCLRVYPQAFATGFNEEYRQTVDVRTGLGLEVAALDDEVSTINESHEIDLGEVLRQEILVALPMRPDCGAACPGPDVLESADDEPTDPRLAALARLLDQNDVASGHSA